MQSVDRLNESFGIAGLLTFDEEHTGMPRARVSSPVCTAELFLQGAHLTQWQPAGHDPVLFLSPQSAFSPGKAIRGGIPVIFPWFGSPQNSPVPTPPGAASHGFARTSPWTLRFAALAGDDLHLSLTLDGDASRPFSQLQLGLDLILGTTLTLRLTVAYAGAEGSQAGTQPILFEEALHSYLHVGDAEAVFVEGLGDTEFLDKTDGFKRKRQGEEALRFHGETDRPYLNTTSDLILHDPALRRRLHLQKQNSRTTVTWNPGAKLASELYDLAPGDWRRFVCLESANALENALPLRPGEAQAMTTVISVLPWATTGA